MPNYLTVIPAYGRDYKNQAAVKAAWKEGKDFIGMSPLRSGAVNKDDAPTDTVIMARYAKLTKIVQVN
jgi:hypothetical protein